jgi:RimJ/RimL family protein N-acetyltransferase
MIKRIKLTKNLSLKEVSLRDVRYVYKLRSDKHLTKYINPRKNDTINKQRVWLKEYLIRRKNHDEFYFIFQIKNKNIYKNLGFARIIRLNQNTFHFGGWILEKNSKPWVALESCLSIYEYAFKKLKYKKSLLWINLKNSDVINYHKYLGAKFVKKDNREIYLSFDMKRFLELRKKFKNFFL